LRPGTTVVDCNVPLASEVGGRPTRMLGVWEGSAAQQAKGILGKKFPIAAGFHTIMAGALADLSEPLHGDVLVCGEADAKDVVKGFVGLIPGARFVDCGPLETARILESLTALLIGINGRYKLDPGAGIKISNLPG
jgi:8-hydroxy-5-deazaflavin:NADPH oxidoreductase